MNFLKRIIRFPYNIEYVALGLIILAMPLVFVPLHQQQIIYQHAATATMPYVAGSKIIDPASGRQIILRGVQIPSEFNLGWKGGGTINGILGPQVMSAIHSWGANTLRLPVGAYEYTQSGYMSALDTVVQNANKAGLYVIFANFEDGQAMGGNGVLDQQGLKFWQFMATHYAGNTMVMYDLINEPHNASWQEWLNGGGGVVGLQQAVNAIRSAGGKQIIVAETIDNNTSGFSGFTSFIQDPNIMYSRHIYFKTAADRTTAGWDSSFGNLAQSYPVLIGEWAMLPNARYPSFCQGLDATSGTLLVNTFLQYMEKHSIHWTAWAFNVPHLILSESAFTPTTMQDSWCCGQGPVCNAGMGQLIKNYLSSSTPPPSITQNPSPTGVNSVTPNPTVTNPPPPTSAQQTIVGITVCPHGLGNCGDNVNPASGGNTNPIHPQRNINISVLDASNQLVVSSQTTLTYNQTAQNFQGSTPFTLSPGQYLFQVEMNGFLSRQISGIQNVSPGGTLILPTTSLVTGDINNDNQLDILDYNILISCFGSKQQSSSCSDPTASDVNDDGKVDGTDYNLFLRELSVQHGNN